jgi:segregation and condensation protein A
VPYQVRLAIFEGPLDLLLQLIEKHQLDITTVALAQVADQYLEYIGLLPDLDPALLSDFLVIAARLLLIKSKALLPRPLAEPEEEEEDDAETLARQLLEYRRFKEVAAQFRRWEQAGLRTYVRSAPLSKSDLNLAPRFSLEGVSLDDLSEALRAALARLAPGQPTETIAPILWSINDKIAAIQKALTRGGRASLQSLLVGVTTRVEAIVIFLALLELIKAREVQVAQDATFGEILIFPNGSAKGSENGNENEEHAEA